MVAIILEREEQRRMVLGGNGPPSSSAAESRRKLVVSVGQMPRSQALFMDVPAHSFICSYSGN